MSDPVYPIDPTSLASDANVTRDLGKRYAESYQSAQPYNYICIDDFMPPEILNRVREDLSNLPQAESKFNRAQERLKTSYLPERLPDYPRQLFQAFNSRPFIVFLEQMTGIKGLIPDPYFMGAGIHKVASGGHLDIHADFNLHSGMNVERRLNVLIYLNPDWKAEWGGAFEIWDKAMKHQVKSFLPIFNRMVCFSTASDTFHGNPEPVKTPGGEARLSIALYYYTATWDKSRVSHTTLFQPRPGTTDEVDKTIKRRQLVADLVPPLIYRKIVGRLRKLGF